MNYEWFLFDLDGTLAESGAGILNSVRYALTQLGAEIPPEEEMRAFIGPPLLWSFQNVAHLPEETARRAVDLYRERYGREGWMETSIYPGVQELLRGIRRRGGKIALASARASVKKYWRISAWRNISTGSAPSVSRIITRKSGTSSCGRCPRKRIGPGR